MKKFAYVHPLFAIAFETYHQDPNKWLQVDYYMQYGEHISNKDVLPWFKISQIISEDTTNSTMDIIWRNGTRETIPWMYPPLNAPLSQGDRSALIKESGILKGMVVNDMEELGELAIFDPDQHEKTLRSIRVWKRKVAAIEERLMEDEYLYTLDEDQQRHRGTINSIIPTLLNQRDKMLLTIQREFTSNLDSINQEYPPLTKEEASTRLQTFVIEPLYHKKNGITNQVAPNWEKIHHYYSQFLDGHLEFPMPPTFLVDYNAHAKAYLAKISQEEQAKARELRNLLNAQAVQLSKIQADQELMKSAYEKRIGELEQDYQKILGEANRNNSLTLEQRHQLAKYQKEISSLQAQLETSNQAIATSQKELDNVRVEYQKVRAKAIGTSPSTYHSTLTPDSRESHARPPEKQATPN